MLNPLRLRALTQMYLLTYPPLRSPANSSVHSTLTRRISTSSILLSNPISNPPDSQSATAQQHPKSSTSSSSSSKSESPGPGGSAGSPSASATDSKSNKTQNQDGQEAAESVPESDMNMTQYGTAEAVEGVLTEQSGEKERRGDA